MSEIFEKALAFVLGPDIEGGLSVDDRDPGNWTSGRVGIGHMNGSKYGISARCLHPNTRVLDENLNWVKIATLRKGDKVIAFDEEPERHGKLNLRRFRLSVVEKIGPVYLPASIIKTNKRTIIASDDHLWLRRWAAHRVFEWCKTSDLLKTKKAWHPKHKKSPVLLASVFDPWETIINREAGYLAGILDGEGHYSGGHLGFTQKDNLCAAQAISCADMLGIKFRKKKRKNDVYDFSLINDKKLPYYGLRIIGQLGAERLKKRAVNEIINKSISSPNSIHEEVLSVDPIGEQYLIGIETCSKTIIAEGLLSHNSYPHLDIANLTIEQAKDIYRDEYWKQVHGDEVGAVALPMFDEGINGGPRKAICLLQSALKVEMDGNFGPATKAALDAADMKELIIWFTVKRIIDYTQLNGWLVNRGGWVHRAVKAAILGYNLIGD